MMAPGANPDAMVVEDPQRGQAFRPGNTTAAAASSVMQLGGTRVPEFQGGRSDIGAFAAQKMDAGNSSREGGGGGGGGSSSGGGGGIGGMIANFLKDSLDSVKEMFGKRRNPSYMRVASYDLRGEHGSMEAEDSSPGTRGNGSSGGSGGGEARDMQLGASPGGFENDHPNLPHGFVLADLGFHTFFKNISIHQYFSKQPL